MKTVKIEFPIQEAVEALRLLRGETKCLLDNSETFQDQDVLKRAQIVLSARERIVTALEEIASTEEEPNCRPAFVSVNIPEAAAKSLSPHEKAMDVAMASATGGKPALEGEFQSGIAQRHF